MSTQFGTTEDGEETTAIPASAALCTAILSLDVTAPVVNDVLWRNFFTREVGTYATPTREGAIESVFSLNSVGLESLGRSISDHEVLLEVVQQRNHPSLLDGAVSNPYLDLTGLQWIVDNSGGDTNALAEDRLAASGNLTAYITTGSGKTDTIVKHLLDTSESRGLAEAYRQGGDLATSVVDALNGTTDVHVRRGVLRFLAEVDTNASDRLHGELLETADVVDTSLLRWLKESSSWDAELFRARTFPEQGESEFAKRLAERLEENAAYWALEIGEMPNLAATSKTKARMAAEWFGYEGPEVRRQDVVQLDRNATTQRGNIMTWTALGLAPEVIANMIFNGDDGIPHDELLEVIAMGGTTQLAEYLCGAKKRLPHRGDAAALWEKLDKERQTFAVAAIASYPDLGEKPWSAELVLVAPKILAKEYSPTLVWTATRTLLARIDSDGNAWEVAMNLLGDWNGTLDELVETARNIVPETTSLRWANTTEAASRMLFGED